MLLYLNRQVSVEEGDAKSREVGVMFIEASAKAGFNIKVKFNKFSNSSPYFWFILVSVLVYVLHKLFGSLSVSRFIYVFC